MYFNASYKYTITGLYNGNVKVWRLPLILSVNKASLSVNRSSLSVNKSSLSVNKSFSSVNKPPQSNLSNDYIMIHNCLYHTKQVEKIVATLDDRVVLSQSADLTVCLWSLETF